MTPDSYCFRRVVPSATEGRLSKPPRSDVHRKNLWGIMVVRHLLLGSLDKLGNEIHTICSDNPWGIVSCKSSELYEELFLENCTLHQCLDRSRYRRNNMLKMSKSCHSPALCGIRFPMDVAKEEIQPCRSGLPSSADLEVSLEEQGGNSE